MSDLNTPIQIGHLKLQNRLYRAPVLEGAGQSSQPGAVYAKHFVPNAEAGLGLVVQGNTIVLPEGRTSPGMGGIRDRERVLELAPMVDAVHRAGGKIVMQLGHGGTFALESWHRQFVEARTTPPWAPSPLPLWLRAVHSKVHVLTTEEVDKLVERFGVVAGWARRAGYDGVQLAASNAKLLHQFLSSTYNRRQDVYGGNVHRRFELLRRIRAAIGRHAGEDYPVLLKYAAVEEGALSIGYDLADGISFAQQAEDAGFAALTPVIANVLPTTAICRGSFPGASFTTPSLRKKLLAIAGRRRFELIRASMWLSARRYPFKSLWNRHVFAAVKQAVDIPVFAVGGIRTPAEANALLEAGDCDLVGVGRPFYTEPDLAARFLAATTAAQLHAAPACESCNRCMVPQMLGMPGVCYNPSSLKRAKHMASRSGLAKIA